MLTIPRVQHLRPTEDHAMFNLDVSHVIDQVLDVMLYTECLTLTQTQVMLRVLCGLSDTEIAKDFACSKQNIASIRQEAWKRLQKRLPDILPEYTTINWHDTHAGRPKKDQP